MILLRTHFSLHLAQAAGYQAKMAHKVYLDGSEEAAIALSSYVIGSIMMSCALLEATGNEIFENADRPNRKGTDRSQPQSLARLNEYLKLKGLEPISDADPRWISVKTLLELRNRLTHYNHDWLDGGTDNMMGEKALVKSELYARLKSQFEFLPYPVHYIPWFLSPDCAAWSINSVLAILDEFFARLDVSPYYAHLRERIECSR